MGQAANHGARGLLGIENVFLAANSQQAIHGLQFDKEGQRGDITKGGDDHVRQGWPTISGIQGQTPPNDGAAFTVRLLKGAPPGNPRHLQLADGLAEQTGLREL